MCLIVSALGCSMAWKRDRPRRWAMMRRAVFGETDGLAALAVQYSDERRNPQESFIVCGWMVRSVVRRR
jgi:hypothetical protein